MSYSFLDILYKCLLISNISDFIGYLCKDKSDAGVRKLLEDGSIPLDRLLVETDAPFMYPNTRASKLPLHVKDGLTERYKIFRLSYTIQKIFFFF